MKNSQKETLLFIKKFTDEHNYAPTIQEIADACNISKSGAYGRLMTLEKNHYISMEIGKQRTIKIIKKIEE